MPRHPVVAIRSVRPVARRPDEVGIRRLGLIVDGQRWRRSACLLVGSAWPRIRPRRLDRCSGYRHPDSAALRGTLDRLDPDLPKPDTAHLRPAETAARSAPVAAAAGILTALGRAPCCDCAQYLCCVIHGAIPGSCVARHFRRSQIRLRRIGPCVLHRRSRHGCSCVGIRCIPRRHYA